jgi:hypothetical protein
MKMEINGISPIQFCVVLLIIEVAIFFSGFISGARWGIKRTYEQWDRETQKMGEINEEVRTLEILERIITAESNAKHKNVWGQDSEYGICQMKKETFLWLVEKVGLPNPNWKDQAQQIYLLRWAIENGYASHWSTYEKAKKGGD